MSRAAPDIITSETRASLLQTSVFEKKKKKKPSQAVIQAFQNGKSEVPEVNIKTELCFSWL